MIRTTIALLAFAALPATALAAPADEAVRAITSTLDKFNNGDVDAFIAAHAPDAVIVDEFAPYRWTGENVVQRWLADYARDAEARQIKDGRIVYGKPTQASAVDGAAYVVLPTTYCLTQAGKPHAGEGTMTFVMRPEGGAWKISSWTYSAPLPQPYSAKQGKCGKAK